VQHCAPISRGNGEVDRMTMTLNCLLNSKNVILYFYGNKKLEVFEQAKKAKSLTLPVSYLLHQKRTPVSLFWAE
jgi:6-phosphogluconolactonase